MYICTSYNPIPWDLAEIYTQIRERSPIFVGSIYQLNPKEWS